MSACRSQGDRLLRGACPQGAERAAVAGRGGRAAFDAGQQLGPFPIGLVDERSVAPAPEAAHERGLRTRRTGFEFVEHFLVSDMAIAGRHRAFLDLVVDAADY